MDLVSTMYVSIFSFGYSCNSIYYQIDSSILKLMDNFITNLMRAGIKNKSFFHQQFKVGNNSILMFIITFDISFQTLPTK